MANFKFIFVVILFLSNLMVSSAFAASVEKAQMLNKHGLVKEAKAELIEVIFGKSDDSSKAQAYYLLGVIAFEENKVNVAIDSWRDLIKNFPESDMAKLVKDKVIELAEFTSEIPTEAIDNALALSYLKNGDFWAKGKTKTFSIDSSATGQNELAIKWYDKVISEFPKSIAARVAYENKIFLYLSLCIKEGNDKNISQVIEVFTVFEKEFPTANSLQPIRFQIAQAYRKANDRKRSIDWVNIVYKNAGEGESLYKDLAEKLLK